MAIYVSAFVLFLPLIVACTRRAPQESTITTASYATNVSSVPYKLIEGDPLTIYVAEDASYQIEYRNSDGSQSGQVYPPFDKNADSGLFVTYNNFVIGPNFEAEYRITIANIYDPWEPINQTNITGSGLTSDPWIISTQVSHSSGITMTSQTSYVNGDNFFTINWEICLPDSAQVSTFLAGDFSLVGENHWDGFFNNLTSSVGATNSIQNWSESFTPDNPTDHYKAGNYKAVWDAIGSPGSPGPGFDDLLATNESSIAAGLQWDLSVTDCATTQAQWCVGPSETCPSISSDEERTFIPLIYK
jgi:hypothetical protein